MSATRESTPSVRWCRNQFDCAGTGGPTHIISGVRLVTKALEEADGNRVEAAGRLGLHPNNLHRLIKNLNVKVS